MSIDAKGYIDFLETDIGILEIKANQKAIASILFCETLKQRRANDVTEKAKIQLSEYFAGTRKSFTLPLDPTGTEFQKHVWKHLCFIEYGTTASYLDIACMLDKPNASRAVGMANGKNPISIVIPCHRIIGKSGKLTGYAGGLDRKAWLLSLESDNAEFQLS